MLYDARYAAMCVKHEYVPRDKFKMDGKQQFAYPRKNWSSLVLWNCSHPANRVLTPKLVSAESASYLHRFNWLTDDLIGSLPSTWNWLEGEYERPRNIPFGIHFTRGGPWFPEYRNVEYANEWNTARVQMNNARNSDIFPKVAT